MTDARHITARDGRTDASLRKLLVCVIDDDYDVLNSLQFFLETEGFDVRTFRSGAALLGSEARSEADCLIVDYKMAGIDGIELAYKLRHLGINTPVVLITGYPDGNILAKAGQAGVRHVLLKPHLEDSLVASDRNAVSSSRAPG